MSESSDPKAYPGVWKGIVDEKPVDRIVEGNKMIKELVEHGPRVTIFTNADRFAVVEMCREVLHDRFGYVGDPGLDRLVDSALDAVKDKIK